jgi:carbon storage regulator
MLVLSRKPGQCVRIGDEIEVTVLDVQGDRVRLGFKAPPDVSVHRQEVYMRIEQETDARQHKLFAIV